jgi:hypothetical protein
VSPDVLDLPEVVIADGNAARWETRFDDVTKGLAALDHERIHTRYWTHDDPVETYEHKRIKQAEVLVPDSIHPRYIVGAYVPTAAAGAAVRAATGGLTIVETTYTFFDGHGWH